jgi:hypothetical protein
MITFDEIIQEEGLFQDFVRELAPIFKEPKFQNYLDDTYSESREWKAVSALNGRIPMASLIDPYDGKPIIGSEKPLDMWGEMPTFGNKVVFTSKELNKIKSIERAIAANMADPTQVIKYVRNYFERLVVGPLTAMDKLFFEAWSNGTSTVVSADNLSKLSMAIDWGIHKRYVSTVWATAATATGIEDLKALAKYMKDEKGVIVDRFTMNGNTLDLLLAQNSTKASLSSYFSMGNGSIKWTGTPSLEAVNTVLVSNFRLPPIVVEEHMVSYYNEDGITIKKTEQAFKDGRVTASVGDQIGQYMWTPADEQYRPDANVMYQDINHVLISKRGERGAVTFESELSAIPIPTLMDQMSILVTDATSA